MRSFDQRSCKNTTELRGKEYSSRSFLFHLDELQAHFPDVIQLCVYNAFILHYAYCKSELRTTCNCKQQSVKRFETLLLIVGLRLKLVLCINN